MLPTFIWKPLGEVRKEEKEARAFQQETVLWKDPSNKCTRPPACTPILPCLHPSWQRASELEYNIPLRNHTFPSTARYLQCSVRQWNQILLQQALRRASTLGLHRYQQESLATAGSPKYNEGRWEGRRLDHGLLSPLISIWSNEYAQRKQLWWMNQQAPPHAPCQLFFPVTKCTRRPSYSSASWIFSRAWKGPGLLLGSVDTK